jgi:Restriction endonuclease fold toxin 7
MVGAFASVASGGKFADGARAGAFGYLFNHCGHNACWTDDGDMYSPEGNRQGLSNTAGDQAGLVANGVLLAGATGAAVVGPGFAAALYESAGGMSLVRYAGAQGEAAVGWIGEKTAILNASGRMFIADGVTFASVNEVKNVAALSLTPQIRAFGDFAVQSGRQFTLWVRSETTFSAPLNRYIQSIGAQVKTIPGK